MTMIRSAGKLIAARARALEAVYASFADDQSPIAIAVRKQFKLQLAATGPDAGEGDRLRAQHGELHRQALHAARQAVVAMRANSEIGDDAFHQIEEQLDWLEMAGGLAPLTRTNIGADAKVRSESLAARWQELYCFSNKLRRNDSRH